MQFYLLLTVADTLRTSWFNISLDIRHIAMTLNVIIFKCIWSNGILFLWTYPWHSLRSVHTKLSTLYDTKCMAITQCQENYYLKYFLQYLITFNTIMYISNAAHFEIKHVSLSLSTVNRISILARYININTYHYIHKIFVMVPR